MSLANFAIDRAVSPAEDLANSRICRTLFIPSTKPTIYRGIHEMNSILQCIPHVYTFHILRSSVYTNGIRRVCVALGITRNNAATSACKYILVWGLLTSRNNANIVTDQRQITIFQWRMYGVSVLSGFNMHRIYFGYQLLW